MFNHASYPCVSLLVFCYSEDTSPLLLCVHIFSYNIHKHILTQPDVKSLYTVIYYSSIHSAFAKKDNLNERLLKYFSNYNHSIWGKSSN